MIRLLLALAAAQEPAPAPQESKDPVLTATFKDGIRIKSSDGEFDMLVGGYLGYHYRAFAHRPEDDVRTSPDSFFLRQARAELSGMIYRDFDYRLVLDFATNAVPASGTLQDGYVGWKYWPWLSLRLGQFKEPFGQEQTAPDRVLEFNERSDIDRLTPQRDIGAMVYGKVEEGLLSYELGVFNGQGRAVMDATDDKEVAARLRSLPFALEDDGFLFKRLRVGVAGTAGTTTKATFNGLDFTSTDLNILFLDSTAGQIDGPRLRLGAELTWNCGPFGLRTEVVQRTDTVDLGARREEKLRHRGGNLALAWIVTGEDKLIETRLVPTDPFNPRTGGWGAVELALRADRLAIDDDIFSLGIANPAGQSDEVTTFVAGVNWRLTRNIRVSPNLVWEKYDDVILFADGHGRDSLYGGILRFQVEF
jgi:phosphate-selective porin OprO/OprP